VPKRVRAQSPGHPDPALEQPEPVLQAPGANFAPPAEERCVVEPPGLRWPR
jgi:hypothetical protein